MVETEDAYKFAGQMGIQLFETSAKENVNVEEVSLGWGGSGAPHCSSAQGTLVAHSKRHRNCRLLRGCCVPGTVLGPSEVSAHLLRPVFGGQVAPGFKWETEVLTEGISLSSYEAVRLRPEPVSTQSLPHCPCPGVGLLSPLPASWLSWSLQNSGGPR